MRKIVLQIYTAMYLLFDSLEYLKKKRTIVHFNALEFEGHPIFLFNYYKPRLFVTLVQEKTFLVTTQFICLPQYHLLFDYHAIFSLASIPFICWLTLFLPGCFDLL